MSRHAQSTGRSNVRLILAVIACTFYAQIQVFVTMPVTAMQAGVSAPGVGLLLALPGATSLLIDLPIAALSDAGGRRRFLAAGGMCLVLSGIALAAARSEPTLWAFGTFLAGVAMALLVSPSLAFLTEAAAPDGQARVQGVNGSVQAAASIGAALVSGLVLGAGEPELGFASVAACGIIICACALGAHEGNRIGNLTTRVAFDGYRRGASIVTTSRVALATMLAITYGVLFLVVGNAFLPAFAISIEVPAVAVGVLLGMRTVVVLLLSPSFARVASRVGLLRLMTATTALGAVGLGLVPFAALSAFVLVPSVLLQGIGIAYSAAAANVWIAGATPTDARAVAIAASNLGSRVALLVASPFLAIAAASTPQLPFWLGACALVLVAALMPRVARLGQANEQNPDVAGSFGGPGTAAG